MKGQRYCGSIEDIKMVCPKCFKKYFFPLASYNGRMVDALKENGPLWISCPWCYNGSSGGTEVDLDNPKSWYGDPDAKPPKGPSFDIIYFEEDYALSKEFEIKIKEKFPTAIIGDGSDSIHGKRTTVELAGEFRDEYLTWLVLNYYAGSSFLINMAVQSINFKTSFDFKDDLEIIKKAIKEREQAGKK